MLSGFDRQSSPPPFGKPVLQAPSLDAPPSRARILIAEDNETNRRVLETVLKRAGHRMVSVEDGEQAIEALRAEEPRFDVVYHLFGISTGERMTLKAAVGENEEIPTVSTVWKTANWMEREVYDLFGIHFENHPGLERILTWEGFNGHPLRKDFPVEGVDTGAAIYPEVYPPGGGPVVEETAAEEGGEA